MIKTKPKNYDKYTMDKKDKEQEYKLKEPAEEEPPTYDETMADKNEEQNDDNTQRAPYVKFPHPINKHTAKRASNKSFPGNQTLTYMNKK